MPLPTTDTTVTYPDGATTSTGTVLHVEPLSDGRSAVSSTPRHSIRSTPHGPTSPPDRGTLTTAAGEQPIVDGVTGGTRDGQLHLGADMPVRTGTEGWTFVVAHIIEGPPPAVGESVQINARPESPATSHPRQRPGHARAGGCREARNGRHCPGSWTVWSIDVGPV